ncbi:hypothetical protein [Hymenobacter swuensis]|uniref:Uncharacterized protein n=1 Tax=Hymenobacter swuensis DY53 TaxID=1227739 RepID=W8FBQ2_9BACT|nr:hypothetical protein [Hymenobacter swuensis]AHJ99125.1 hypothetical protein Hsw_3530 [Hymenobacter swuensis DY53]
MRPALLIAMFLFLHSSVALACSCVGGSGSEKQQIATAYQRDALVFVGRVVAVETVVTTDTLQVSDTGPLEQRTQMVRKESFRYTFTVSRKYKGLTTEDTVLVSSATQSASCGREFKAGAEYLLYGFQISEKASPYGGPATPIPPYFATSLCNRGQELKDVKRAELKQLKKLAQAG